MKKLPMVVFVTVLAAGLGGPAWAAGDKDVNAILDKAIKALGGEEKLGCKAVISWTAKGTVNFGFGGRDANLTTHTTVQGLYRYREDYRAKPGPPATLN